MNFTQELYEEIVQKTWDDAKFKDALITNPIETIESFTGKKLNLPEGKTLVVRDQTDENIVYFNIPAKQELNTELSEEQLEAVAGGYADPNQGKDNTGGPTIYVPTLPKDIICW